MRPFPERFPLILSAMLAATIMLADTTPAAATAATTPAPAVSAAPAKAPAPAKAAAKSDGDQVVCKTETVLGSRFPKKSCYSTKDYAQRLQEDRANL